MTDARPTLASPDDYPYLWLEEIEGMAAVAWADEQTRATRARYGDARFQADRGALRTLLDRPDNLPVPTRRGGLLYNFWKDAANPRGIWRRTTLESFRTDQPEWDVLLDLDALAAAEGEDWVWSGASTLPPAYERALLSLSRGGSDASVKREFDLRTRRFVTDGFVLPEAKGGASWIDQDTLVLSSALGGITRSGYAKTVRLWRRGEPWSDAPILFETIEANMSAWGYFDRQGGRLVFGERTGFFDANVWIGDRDGPKQKIDLPTDAWYSWDREWLVVRSRTNWTAGGTTHKADVVVVIRFADFLVGGRAFRTLFQPGPRQAVQGFFWAAGKLVLNVLDNLRPLYLVFTPGDWHSCPMPGVPEIGTASAWRLDMDEEESDGSLLAMMQDPVTPPSLLLTDVDLGARRAKAASADAMTEEGYLSFPNTSIQTPPSWTRIMFVPRSIFSSQ